MSNIIQLGSKAAANSQVSRLSLLDQLHNAGTFYDVVERGNFFDDGMGGFEPTGKKTLINGATGLPISVMSEQYTVVQNRQIFEALDRQIAASGLNLDGAYTRVTMQNNGAQCMVQYIFPAHSIDVGGGDKSSFMITAINSFNGSTSFFIYIGAYRGYCSNGQVFGTGFVSYRKQHCRGLDIERAADTVKTGLQVFMQEGDAWKRMTKRVITEQMAYMALADMADVDTNKFKTYAEYLAAVEVTAKRTTKLENYVRIFQNYVDEMGCNEFALYNTITHITTHGAAKAGNRVQAVATFETRSKHAELICRKHLQSYSEAA